MKRSWMVGDKKSDIEAGKNAGVGKTVFIKNGEKEEPSADYSVDRVSELEVLVKQVG